MNKNRSANGPNREIWSQLGKLTIGRIIGSGFASPWGACLGGCKGSWRGHSESRVSFCRSESMSVDIFLAMIINQHGIQSQAS